MVPFVTHGQFWKVTRVSPGDLRLIDRTGTLRLATTDPESHEIFISDSVTPPLLDYVLLHEISHAIGVSSGATHRLRAIIPQSYWIPVEEWSANFMENFALESIGIASKVLGRPVCIGGVCHD